MIFSIVLMFVKKIWRPTLTLIANLYTPQVEEEVEKKIKNMLHFCITAAKKIQANLKFISLSSLLMRGQEVKSSPIQETPQGKQKPRRT